MTKWIVRWPMVALSCAGGAVAAIIDGGALGPAFWLAMTMQALTSFYEDRERRRELERLGSGR